MKDQYVFACIVGLLLLGLFYCNCYKKKKTENFVPITGGMQNLGSIDYDLVDFVPALDSDQLLSAPNFADLVDSGDEMIVPPAKDRPFDRLQELNESYMPRIASKALPFSQAAAKPMVHSFSVGLPRVNLKGKLYEMNLSEAVRGSVYINYDPNVALIGKSRYSGADSYNVGMFTPQFDSMYNKLAGSYKNMPMYTSGASQAGGKGGNGIDLIMDM